MGSAASERVSDDDGVGLLLKRLRHTYSPAARRAREAARKNAARVEYTTWVAEQRRGLTKRTDTTAAELQ
jgi:hypothetical protein